MQYCPNCGKKLEHHIIVEEKNIKNVNVATLTGITG